MQCMLSSYLLFFLVNAANKRKFIIRRIFWRKLTLEGFQNVFNKKYCRLSHVVAFRRMIALIYKIVNNEILALSHCELILGCRDSFDFCSLQLETLSLPLKFYLVLPLQSFVEQVTNQRGVKSHPRLVAKMVFRIRLKQGTYNATVNGLVCLVRVSRATCSYSIFTTAHSRRFDFDFNQVWQIILFDDKIFCKVIILSNITESGLAR